MNRLVLPCVLLAACTDAPRDTSTTAAASGSFVRSVTDPHGRPRFSVDGHAFRFIGGNLTELPWLDPAAQDPAAVRERPARHARAEQRRAVDERDVVPVMLR